MTYDHWKTTNPADEWLGPEPGTEEDEEMPPRILTRAKLDPMGCSTPNCNHDHSELYLTARCHEDAGLEVRYVKATGLLVCECAKCGKEAATIQVAP